ncbi:hypothetical protein AB0F15_37845 [Amycolatopsis sp. NPDC026612]|uniref:hypothetical protein n=1 Tax=Amycolatopsis sp. NPDC026612 TaxID=3155466 RepID=UPI0033FF5549
MTLIVFGTGTLVLGFGQEAADAVAPVPAAAETTSAATAATRTIRVTDPAESRRTRPGAGLLTRTLSAVTAGRIGDNRHSIAGEIIRHSLVLSFNRR